MNFGEAVNPGVVGYFLGTLQILVLEWVRRRRVHARQLRLVRADLRMVAARKMKFAWGMAGQEMIGSRTLLEFRMVSSRMWRVSTFSLRTSTTMITASKHYRACRWIETSAKLSAECCEWDDSC